eukprot:TRINITY_DN3832_c0_g1_i1.p1 TRINITY_DN3832_c0_g1~~TRINITY_DN3832_c0_g1_i1.p1  ORF type:complete len:395 (-),score=98.56 TRINITY_DN3832_c0_g1_i1:95-1279(-)
MSKWGYGVGVLVLIVGVCWFWVLPEVMGPWYTPGDITGRFIDLRDPLVPPLQRTSSFESAEWSWLVANDIALYAHTTFTLDCSPPGHCNKDLITVLVIHGGPGIPYEKPWEALEMVQEDTKINDRHKYNYRFIYYHQRGSGNSSRPILKFKDSSFSSYQTNMRALVELYGIQEQVADIERIRKILIREGSLNSQEEKLIIVGHSFGGFLATLYAAEFPMNVKGLILVEPAHMLKFPVEKDIFHSVRGGLQGTDVAHFDEWKQKYLDFSPLLFNKTDKEIATIHSQFFDFWKLAVKMEKISPPPVELVGGWMVFGMYCSMGLSYDFTEHVQKIQVPVLLVHGDKDLVPLEHIKLYQELLVNAQLERIEEASHFPFQETPSQFSTILLNFLKSLEN